MKVIIKIGVHRQSYRNVLEYWLHGRIAGDTLKSQTSSQLRESFFVSKKLILETIVQVARSLGTKSLDTNRIFSMKGLSNFVDCNHQHWPEAT